MNISRSLAVVFVCTILIFFTEGLSNSTSDTVAAIEVTKSSAKPVTTGVEAKSTPVVLHIDSTTVDNVAKMAEAEGVEAIVGHVEPHIKVAEANASVNLSCPLDGTEVIWSKSGIDIKDDKSYKLHGDGSLEVLKPGVDSFGDFQCSVNGKNETVSLYVKPYIHSYKAAKNVIEDDPFVMDCKVWGYPSVVLTWHFNGSNMSSNEHYVFKPGQYYNNSVLRIPHTSYADAGLYECIATNAAGNDSMSMNVTIKDKFAAVWPFLGICAEVAILCTVIFIYEKRRERRLRREQEVADIEEKQELKENGLSVENDAKATTDLRQRNK